MGFSVYWENNVQNWKYQFNVGKKDKLFKLWKQQETKATLRLVWVFVNLILSCSFADPPPISGSSDIRWKSFMTHLLRTWFLSECFLYCRWNLIIYFHCNFWIFLFITLHFHQFQIGSKRLQKGVNLSLTLKFFIEECQIINTN